jgi:hypothetical protein
LPKLSNIVVGKELINSFDISNLDLEVILYQAGYLTIESMYIDEDLDITEYKLKIPNREVKVSLNNYIINIMLQKTDYNRDKKSIIVALKQSNMDNLKEALISIFASIPYNYYTKNDIKLYEGFYASIIYVYFQSLGINIIGEDVTNQGRIDLTLFIEDKIYIVEFKTNNNTQNALSQIKDKNYHQKYLSSDKEIFLVGIEFDTTKKNISSLEWEKVNE